MIKRGGFIDKKENVTNNVVKVSAEEPSVVMAKEGFSTSFPDRKVPDSIQLFPPGEHLFTAATPNGPITATVVINEAVAAAIKSDFDNLIAQCKAGTGPKPYIDFNHDDQEAAGHPVEIYWGGDDPITGGVRAKMVNAAGETTFSRDGADKITGGSYRAFSPNFQFNRDSSRILGTYPNMGGLVNRPAFRQIAPISAKEETKTPVMKKLLLALKAAGLVNDDNATDDVAASEFTSKFDTLRKKGEVTDTNLVQVTAKSVESDDRLKTALKENGDLRKQVAEQVVAKAVTDGRLAPKDTAGHEKWIQMLCKDPSASELLGAMPPKADPTGRITEDNRGADLKKGDQTEQTFEVRAKEHMEKNKVSYADACIAIHRVDPKAYTGYAEQINRNSRQGVK